MPPPLRLSVLVLDFTLGVQRCPLPLPNQLLGRNTKKSSCGDEDACGPLRFQEVTVGVLTSRLWPRGEQRGSQRATEVHTSVQILLWSGADDSVGALIAALDLGCSASFI